MMLGASLVGSDVLRPVLVSTSWSSFVHFVSAFASPRWSGSSLRGYDPCPVPYVSGVPRRAASTLWVLCKCTRSWRLAGKRPSLLASPVSALLNVAAPVLQEKSWLEGQAELGLASHPQGNPYIFGRITAVKTVLYATRRESEWDTHRQTLCHNGGPHVWAGWWEGSKNCK